MANQMAEFRNFRRVGLFVCCCLLSCLLYTSLLCECLNKYQFDSSFTLHPLLRYFILTIIKHNQSCFDQSSSHFFINNQLIITQQPHKTANHTKIISRHHHKKCTTTSTNDAIIKSHMDSFMIDR